MKAVTYPNGQPSGELVLETASQKIDLVLNVDKLELDKGVENVAYIELQLVDEKGRLNLQEVREVEVSVAGAITLQGFGSADPPTFNHDYERKWNTYDGRLLAIARATNEAGTGTVQFTCNGVTKELEIKVK